MPGDDTLLLVVASCITSQLKDLSGKVLKDGSEVDYKLGQKSWKVAKCANLPGAPAPTRCA